MESIDRTQDSCLSKVCHAASQELITKPLWETLAAFLLPSRQGALANNLVSGVPRTDRQPQNAIRSEEGGVTGRHSTADTVKGIELYIEL